MGTTDSNLTEPQREFQRKLDDLLLAHASVIGPHFDGDDEGIDMDQPVPIGWLLISDWDDLSNPDADGAVVMFTSSRLRMSQKAGLIEIARSIAQQD